MNIFSFKTVTIFQKLVSFPEPNFHSCMDVLQSLRCPPVSFSRFHLPFLAPRSPPPSRIQGLRLTAWAYCSLSITGCQLYSLDRTFVISITGLWRDENWEFQVGENATLYVVCCGLHYEFVTVGYHLIESNVYWTVHHCISWRMKNQLDVTCYFISLIMRSTCFGH